MPGLLARRRPLPKPLPESDPRYRKVMEQLKRGAAHVKAHPSAAKKAAEASKAAKGPSNERLAAGKAKQVEKIEAAPTSKPQPSSFLEVLQAEIAKAMPKTLADTEKFMKGGSAGELKGSLKGNVAQQKDQAEGGVKSASKEAPKETGPGTPGAALTMEAPPAAPAINGADAMPAPKSDAEVSLQDSKQETDEQMKEADVTETQLKKANDPRFSAVLTSKDQVAKQADAAPAQFRAQEKQVLSASAVAAKVAGAKGANTMVGVRGGSNSAVLSRQAAAKAKDEARRKEVVDHIEQIYNRTKQNVEAKLSSLETDVNAMFDSGTDAAVKAMTDYTEAKIDEYKDDRYSGIIGKGRWIRDQFKGLPDEANVFYEQGRALFTRLMNGLVVKVAAIVEQRLKEAKDEVSRGQAEIKSYVDSQPKDLQAVAKKAQEEVTERFHELEHSIDDKKQQLAESLAQKYKEGFNKANEALKKIQDANKGLVAGFIEKLKAVIEAIIEFKNKLMGILRKGAAALKLIIADPIGFLGNLLSAIKQGFSQFADNIWTHLKSGFMKWMFGSLAEMGVEIPTDLTLPSILKLVLGVLGITYERIRAKAVRLVGERAVKFVEKVVDYLKTLFTGGFAALWEKVKEDLSNLKEMVIDAIQDWLITTIVKKAITKIATMFNPVGAIVAAIMAIIDVVVFVVEKANQILEFVSAVVDSVAAIAQGQIAAAANWIERALANMIPLLIGFLAQLLGLGGISKKIKDFITKIQDRVDKAVDKAVKKIVEMLKGLFAAGKDKPAGGKAEKADEDTKGRWEKGTKAARAVIRDPKKAKDPASVNSELGKIREQYVFKELAATHTGKEWKIHAVLNPEETIVIPDEEKNDVTFIYVRVDAETVKVRLDPAGDEVQIKQKMTALRKEEVLVKGLEIDKSTAKEFLKSLGPDWHVGRLLMSFARRERGLPPLEFLMSELARQKTAMAAIAKPVSEATRNRLVYLGEEKAPLSEFALVYHELEPGQFTASTHPEAGVIEYNYVVGGKRSTADIHALCIVRVNEQGVVEELRVVDKRVKGGKAAVIQIMKKAGWEVSARA